MNKSFAKRPGAKKPAGKSEYRGAPKAAPKHAQKSAPKPAPRPEPVSEPEPKPKPEPAAAPIPTAVQMLVVTADEDGMRLDRWFKRRVPDLSLGHLNHLFDLILNVADLLFGLASSTVGLAFGFKAFLAG